MKKETIQKLMDGINAPYKTPAYTPETIVVVGNGNKPMPLGKAWRYCKPGSYIRLPGRSGNIVERGLDGKWYY